VTRQLNNSVRSAVQKTVAAERQMKLSANKTEEIKQDIAANLKKRKTLEIMCNAIFKKNYDLYFKHELMLEDERQSKMKMAADFLTRKC